MNLTEPLDELTAALDSLTAMLDRRPDFATMLQTVCAHAVQIVPIADAASITLIRRGVARTAASTDGRAVDLAPDHDGPCLEAARTGQPIRAGIASAALRWPEFAADAVDRGLASFLSAPLTVDNDVSGAVNLFGYGSREFGDLDVQLLELYTATVVFGLRSAHRYRVTGPPPVHRVGVPMGSGGPTRPAGEGRGGPAGYGLNRRDLSTGRL